MRRSLTPPRRRGIQFSGGGPGNPSALSEKAVLRLLNLAPLQGFAERERASKEN